MEKKKEYDKPSLLSGILLGIAFSGWLLAYTLDSNELSILLAGAFPIILMVFLLHNNLFRPRGLSYKLKSEVLIKIGIFGLIIFQIFISIIFVAMSGWST